MSICVRLVEAYPQRLASVLWVCGHFHLMSLLVKSDRHNEVSQLSKGAGSAKVIAVACRFPVQCHSCIFVQCVLARWWADSSHECTTDSRNFWLSRGTSPIFCRFCCIRVHIYCWMIRTHLLSYRFPLAVISFYALLHFVPRVLVELETK